MIEELRIRDLGVIVEAVLPLGPGLTVLTGETGAGKTMVLSAIALLLGGKSDPAVVRIGCERADVEGRVAAASVSLVQELIDDAAASLDEDGSLVLARTVAASGRGRSTVGGRGVPVGVLANVGEALVAVHGQHDQVRLLSPAKQREALDRFGGVAVAQAMSRYADLLGQWRAVDAELTDVVANERERLREAETLRLGLAAIGSVNPVAGEDVELAAEVERLTHVEALREAASVAREALSGESSESSDVLGQLTAARRALEHVHGVDPLLDEAATRAAEVAAAAADLAADLSGYLDRLDGDPARLQWVQERIAALRPLLRAYGPGVGEVIEWSREASARLAQLDDDGLADVLRARRSELGRQVLEAAGELTRARHVAAAALSAAVNVELPALAMGSAALVISVDSVALDGPDADLRALAGHGVDGVTFSLKTASDTPARPVAKAASGGELSRLMLALELALSASNPLPTMVFDEVDAGVGGRSAIEIGRRLQSLGRTTQVLVVTHLAQVAAFADHHVVVIPSDSQGVRASDVRVVDGEDRVRELARMLAGLADSKSGTEHAAELLALAHPDSAKRTSRKAASSR